MNDKNGQSIADPNEAAIAEELWRWVFLPENERGQVTAHQARLRLIIEFQLCGLFQLIEFTRSRGIWCDGVLELSITRPRRLEFIIAGAAFCPYDMAPFELEYHSARRRDDQPSRTFLRFGDRRPSCGNGWQSNEKVACRIVANRPTDLADWAVAVEIVAET